MKPSPASLAAAIAVLLPSLQAAAEVPAPTKILCVGSNPADQPRLALTKEIEVIDAKLRGTTYRDAFELEQHWEIQPAELPGLVLRHKPQVVHICGHGGASGALFQDGAGQSYAPPIDAVADTFSVLSKYVRCVVVNTCFSKRQAQAIARGVDVAIGVDGPLADRDAIAFSGAFYEALGYGEDVKTAYELARNAIDLEVAGPCVDRDVRMRQARNERARPELFTRASVDPSRMRFVGT